MSLLDWFSAEARQARREARDKAKLARDRERQLAEGKRQEAYARQRARNQSEIARTIRNKILQRSEDELHEMLQRIQEVPKWKAEDFSATKEAQKEGAASAMELALLGASIYLCFARNFVLVRESVSDVYGLSWSPEADKPSWPELASECVEYLDQARSISMRGGVPLPVSFVENMRERALEIKSMTPEQAIDAGIRFPICAVGQQGGSSMRFSPGFFGRMATTDRRIQPPCTYRRIADLHAALSDVGGSRYILSSLENPE